MRCDVLTIFPEMVDCVIGASILSRGRAKGFLEIRVIDIRGFAKDRHRTVDDAPYGGGVGMILKPEPILAAVEAVTVQEHEVRCIMTSPRGRRFDQHLAEEFSRESRRLVFICGRYEGIDERVGECIAAEGFAVDEISIGDYVLTGGELAALVMIDSAARLVPGVLGDPDSAKEESFAGPLLEYPQYTRPAEFRSVRVPDVLMSGDHEAIRRWRRRMAIEETCAKRPDLLREASCDNEDRIAPKERP